MIHTHIKDYSRLKLNLGRLYRCVNVYITSSQDRI